MYTYTAKQKCLICFCPLTLVCFPHLLKELKLQNLARFLHTMLCFAIFDFEASIYIVIFCVCLHKNRLIFCQSVSNKSCCRAARPDRVQRQRTRSRISSRRQSLKYQNWNFHKWISTPSLSSLSLYTHLCGCCRCVLRDVSHHLHLPSPQLSQNMYRIHTRI